MRLLLSTVLIMLITISCSTSKSIIDTTQYTDFLTLNALEIVGNEFKVDYKFAQSKEGAALDSINKVNETTYTMLRKKHGDDWREKFTKSFNTEVRNLNAYYEVLKQNGLITEDNFVYFIKISKKNRYVAEIYPNIGRDERSSDILIRTVQLYESKEDEGEGVIISF